MATNSSAVTIAVHRFGLGPRPGERAAAASDPRGWVAQQLKSVAVPETLKAMPPIGECLKLLPRLFMKDVDESDKAAATAKREEHRDVVQEHVVAEVWNRFRAGAESTQPFVERLVRFWSNHFAVSGVKGIVMPQVGAYEREAIRANLSGSFFDMALESTRHPAMLCYLDNDYSIGPNSPAGKRRGSGLNENLARELMELHTVGVDGGYTQADVTELARALTGWGIDYKAAVPGYLYYPQRHEPGARTIMGRKYPEGGEEQARAVIADLARHPATARFVASKLARHFVSDTPPPEAVDRLATVFRETDGDLPKLHAALVELPQAWANPGAKFRTPEEFLIGTQRLLAGRGGFRTGKPVFGTLKMLGQLPFCPPSPAGWPDDQRSWLSGDALWTRLEVGSTLAARVHVEKPMEFAGIAFGDDLAPGTHGAIEHAESGTQGLALLLASPEFNRR